MREKIQAFGRALSAMVMPNIGAFIAWGLITAIFIPGGWWPNENIATMVSPMLKYLLPLLIAYTAGKNVGGTRGAVAAAVATMGVIIGSDTPMFLGAMIVGPLAGWCIKKFDKLIEGKVGAGFEMLVDNFSLGIIAMLLAIGGYLVIGHAIGWITGILSNGVNWMLAHKMNPLLSLLVDPSKVLFLNNAVNHGIMTPLGIQQAAETGQSMLFLVDPNPGPGLGMLLACWAFGKGMTKQSAPGAVVIQVFGGIHEIYFPYVLARPVLIFPIIAGNICALLFYTLTNFGLVAPASPGSIISITLMSPKGRMVTGVLGVLIATAVTFLLSCPIIRRRPDFQSDEKPSDSKPGSIPSCAGLGTVSKICFACDAGMGSSALGATRFKARLMGENLGDIICTNCAVSEIPSDASLIVCQSQLAKRARLSGKEVIEISNFLKDPALDALLERLKLHGSNPQAASSEEAEAIAAAPAGKVLEPRNIVLGLSPETKEDAIHRAGQLLVDGGYVGQEYVGAMLAREEEATTYMGMGLALPHGTEEGKKAVISTGIAVLQYPEGVEFSDGEKARLLIAIAGKGDEHMDVMARLAGALEDPDVLERLCTTTDRQQILDIIGES